MRSCSGDRRATSRYSMSSGSEFRQAVFCSVRVFCSVHVAGRSSVRGWFDRSCGELCGDRMARGFQAWGDSDPTEAAER